MPNLTYYSHIPLYHAPSEFLDKIPGIRNFLGLAKLFGPNGGIYDASNTLTIPFKYKPTTSIPRFDLDFDLNFANVIKKRMQELEEKHTTTGKTFRLLYSGGVDSTTMFAAFVDHFGMAKTSKILEISCSPESINENPWLWDRYIRPNNFKLVSSHNHAYGWNDIVMVVMGEGADQLFGGLGSGGWCQYAVYHNIDLYHTIDLDLLVTYLNWYRPGQSDATVKYCAGKLIQIGTNAPIPVTNMYLLVWWYTLAVNWDSFSKRIIAQAKVRNLPTDILSSTLVQFFNTPDFLQWSFKYHHDNPINYGEIKNYKVECKKVIHNILDIPEYAVKSKWLSWPRVHAKRKSAYIIDEDLVSYSNLDDFLKFIEPNNSFL